MIMGISNELFEKKSKEKYEELKRTFLNTIEKIRWDNEKASQEIIDYFIDCTLADIEDICCKKRMSKYEFKRLCRIAKKGIDFLLQG